MSKTKNFMINVHACINRYSQSVVDVAFCSFEMWFDVERLSVDNADEKIVKEEQQKNILSMLHQVRCLYPSTIDFYEAHLVNHHLLDSLKNLKYLS